MFTAQQIAQLQGKLDKAVSAVQTVLPLSWKEASVEAVNAVAYATRYHPELFWRGAQHVAKWRVCN